MGLDTSDVRAFAGELKNIGPATAVKASKVVAKVAYDIEATAKQLAPVDTGALQSSIGSDIHSLSAEIGPTVSYAPYLEFGTSRMAPRPFMGPAADKHEPRFNAAVDALAREAFA